MLNPIDGGSSSRTPIVCNAIIKSASITLDNGSFLCAWLMLDYGGPCQGFGGVVLGGVPSAAAGNHANEPNIAAEWIVSCLLAAGVEQWSDLPGKTIRVKRTHGFVGGDIIAIGHIVKDDLWFNPSERIEALYAAKGGAA